MINFIIINYIYSQNPMESQCNKSISFRLISQISIETNSVANLKAMFEKKTD